jgi:outer membrane receptor protein involved in Fe transport
LSQIALAAEVSGPETQTGTERAPSASGIRPAEEAAPQASRDAGFQTDTGAAPSASGAAEEAAPKSSPEAIPSQASQNAGPSTQPADQNAPGAEPPWPSVQPIPDELAQLSLADLLAIRVPEVSGVSKMREDARQVPMSVYTITREELNRWGTRGILETLQRTPGYSYYNIDQYGQYGALSRGLYSAWRFGQSLELMPFKDHGHTVFAPRMFQSVEVARGPSGLTWGRDASAGLINYNLRDDLEGGEATIELGDHNRRATEVMYGAKLGNNDNFFVGFHYEEQGFDTQKDAPFQSSPIWRSNGIDPSYILAGRVKYKALKALFYYESVAHPVPHIWFTDPQGMEDALAARGFPYPVDRMPNLGWRLELHVPTEAITKKFSFLKTLDPYVYFNGASSEWWVDDVVGVRSNKYDLGLQLNGALFEGNRVRFSIGGDFWGRFTDTDEAMNTKWADDTLGINWFDTQYHTNKTYTRNIFAQVSVALIDHVSIVAGGRIDYIRDDVNNGQLGPANSWTSTSQTLLNATRLGLIYTPHDSITLKYMFNTTKRPPAFNEKFGNPSLRPELTSAHELIAMYRLGRKIQADVTIAYQSLSRIINRAEGINFNTFENVGDATTWAIEWNFKYRVLRPLLLYWNGSWNRARAVRGEVTVDGVTTSVSPPADAQQRLRFAPELTSFVGAEYVIAKTVNINADLRSITGIPYATLAGADAMADAYFVDVTASTKKLWNTVSFGISALNILNGQPNLPAFGEHAGNVNGTLKPEGRRVFGRMTASF